MRQAVYENNIEVLKLLLSHPSLTALTLNQKNKWDGATPVMLAVISNKWNNGIMEHLKLLVADPRVDLDTTDKEGRSLEEVAYNGDQKVFTPLGQGGEEVAYNGDYNWW